MNKLTKRVEKERWAEAQTWERDLWLRVEKQRSSLRKGPVWRLLSFLRLQPKYRGDDYNKWWREQFDGYSFLPEQVDNAIELGCGPYTNMRLILEACTAKYVFLSDPLINTYVNFRDTFVFQAHRKYMAILDNHPIEECPFRSDYFGLVVLINVLDHVMDAELCLRHAMRIVEPGGILIIGQDLTNEDDLRNEQVVNDIGHPIKMEEEWLDKLTGPRFSTIKHRVLAREAGRNPQAHYGTYIFAGRKL